jgi:hypothetical protein
MEHPQQPRLADIPRSLLLLGLCLLLRVRTHGLILTLAKVNDQRVRKQHDHKRFIGKLHPPGSKLGQVDAIRHYLPSSLEHTYNSAPPEFVSFQRLNTYAHWNRFTRTNIRTL